MYDDRLCSQLREMSMTWGLSLPREAADAIEKLSKQVELEHQSGFADGQIAANRKKSRWIPVTERLPRWWETIMDGEPCVTGEPVLVYGPKSEDFYNSMAVGQYVGDRWDIYDDAFTPNDVTHWMPLPEPPKEVNDEDNT